MTYYSSSKRGYTKAPYRVPIAKFGCERCGRRWQSVNGSIGDYQKCKSCYQECYPRQIRMQEPNKKGNQNRETFVAHNSNLCGKCIRLGHSCIESRDDNEDIPVVVSNLEGEEITLEKTNLSNFFVVKDRAVAEKKTNTSNVDRSGDDSEKLVIKKKEDISWREFMDSGRKSKAKEETSKSKVFQDRNNPPAVVVPDISQLKITDDKENVKQQGTENKDQDFAANDENLDVADTNTSDDDNVNVEEEIVKKKDGSTVHAVGDKRDTGNDPECVKEDDSEAETISGEENREVHNDSGFFLTEG